MGLHKGHTNNPKGRPRGRRNKSTQPLRDWLLQLVNSNREQVERDIADLEPKERLQMLERLLQYVLPKPQTQPPDFNNMTEDQINELINQITKEP